MSSAASSGPAWLGIGAQRSGTTWLTDLLTQHPLVDLGTNGKKEQHLLHKVADGVLHITARAAACDGEPGGEIPDHAACHLYQQDWGIPVVLDADGENELLLDLRGVN